MPKIDTRKYIIDKCHLQYPLKSWQGLTLYNIVLLAKCFVNNDKFIIDHAVELEQTPISSLFPDVTYTAEKYYGLIFANRCPKVYAIYIALVVLCNNNFCIEFDCWQFRDQNR